MKMIRSSTGIDFNAEINLEEGWKRIDSAIEKLWTLSGSEEEGAAERIMKSFTKMEQMEAYTVCYRMCVMRGYSCRDQLYAKFNHFGSRYIEERFLPFLANKTGDDLLNTFAFQLEVYQAATKMLRKFFSYLDRYEVDGSLVLAQIVNEKLKRVWDYLPVAFFNIDINTSTCTEKCNTNREENKNVKENELKMKKPLCLKNAIRDENAEGMLKEKEAEVKNRSVNDVIMDLISSEREGKSIQHKIITHYIQGLRLIKDDSQFSPLTAYAVRFEKPFLHESRSYYRKQGMLWSARNEDDPVSFMKLINQFILNEESKSYLPPATLKRLVQVCHLTLLYEWIFAANGLHSVRSHIFPFLGDDLILDGLERLSVKKRKRNRHEVNDRERSERVIREHRQRRNRWFRVLRASGAPLHI